MAEKIKKESILNHHQKKVLKLISEEDYFTSRFYLTGGTALAEFYLRHRLSEDLDFFTEKHEVNILPINQYFERNLKKLGIEKFDTRNVLGLWTFFLTFLDGEVLKVDFNYYPFPRIEKGAKFGKLTIDSVYDIAVNKVHTIAMRTRAKDFIDIFFIIKEKNYDLHDLLMQAKAKFDWDITAMQLGSQFIQAAEMTDYPRMIKKIDHSEWKNFFVAEAKKLKKEIFK